MAKFPRTEPEVIALANGLIAGLTANTTVYPSPLLTIEELTANLNKVIASQTRGRRVPKRWYKTRGRASERSFPGRPWERGKRGKIRQTPRNQGLPGAELSLCLLRALPNCPHCCYWHSPTVDSFHRGGIIGAVLALIMLPMVSSRSPQSHLQSGLTRMR